ncbi:hypothetical protein LK533_16575 [Sphingomonas sp. PL-96]|uniref:hypothetical protein n=1 Tax=Sphingomonas sp. PL-96 TaxID=2887201 RepID=UPI001E3B6ECA|nr:hypothetical protein [Sphingomonas sp. PL-96]MCC2978267.1 hypothetical protein [Sphingomonas sp. PL-96]
MTYPYDQIRVLGKANGQLITSLFQSAREAVEEHARIGAKAFEVVLNPLGDGKPGSVPAFDSGRLAALFGEVKGSREASVARVRSAVEEWQTCCKDVLAQVTESQQAFGESMLAWFQPLTEMSTDPSRKTATVEQAAPDQGARAKSPTAS